jgi:ferric-dicitrate binding protein FerR (iron transport regulator)
MGENDTIWEIILKSKSEHLTDDEQIILNNWLNESDTNKDSYALFSHLRYSYSFPADHDTKDEIFSNIERRIIANQQSLKTRNFILTVAATVAILVGCALFLFRFGKTQEKPRFVEVLAPKGIKSSLLLPDGSKVMLNSESRLIYPAFFTGDTREISFEGEAFFDIKTDLKRPFIVNISKIKVRVVGTRFNLRSYKEDDKIEATLEKGIIDFINPVSGKETRLKPGEQAVFDKRSALVQVRKVDPQLYSGWKTGKFYFKSQSFEEIVRVLERRFAVTIEIRSERLKKEVFTGDFVRGENLDQILSIMKMNTKMSYYQKEQTYIIHEN